MGTTSTKYPLLPAIFEVSLRVPPSGGGAKLIIQPGSIVAEFGWFSRKRRKIKRYEHRAPIVTLIKSRLLPPWMSTTLVLHDGLATVYAVMWVGARRRLRAALTEAGFEVEERSTWFTQTTRPALHREHDARARRS